MLTDFLYKYVSNDESCLLGIIPNENKFAVLLSPLNANTLYPKLSSIETNHWIKKYDIINDENVKVLGKSFISDDTRYDWSITTALNILGNTISTGSNFTFSTKININTANIGNRIIPIFKQGGVDVNDTLDIHFEFNRDLDISGASDKLVINVYYETPSDSSTLNLQSFELTNISRLLNREVQLTVIVDSDNSVIKVLANNELIGRKIMELDKILDLPLNTPQNVHNNAYFKMIIGGSKFMEMGNAYIWKRALSPVEINFLNKINEERFELTTEIPEDIDSLTFTALENSSIKIIKEGNPTINGLYYRISLISDWRPYQIGVDISLLRGTRVQFKNTENNLSLDDSNYVKFVIAGRVEASGDIQSMLNGSDSCPNFCYYNLFSECVNLVKAPELSALTIGYSSYKRMFYQCASLRTPPALPAISLGINCYAEMFNGCTGLKTVPELLCNTVNNGSYTKMFEGCTSIRTVESLPATTVNEYGYYEMFKGCTSLKSVQTTLPPTSLNSNCYLGMFNSCTALETVPNNMLPASTLAQGCYAYMFEGCTNLKVMPNLENATNLGTGNSQCLNMFNGCVSLTTAYKLPALSLASSCYSGMFYGCTSLRNIPEDMLPSVNLTDNCYAGMFANCINLANVCNLPATTLSEGCYRDMFVRCKISSLPSNFLSSAATLANYCYYHMFYECTSLKSVPTNMLPITTLKEGCYAGLFANCRKLGNAPDLPAPSLVSNCYIDLFSGCTLLNQVKASFTNWVSNVNPTTYWLNNVAQTGTFIKADALNVEGITRGASTIPTNWSVVNFSEL